jgi:hypothetical protein
VNCVLSPSRLSAVGELSLSSLNFTLNLLGNIKYVERISTFPLNCDYKKSPFLLDTTVN